MPEPIKIEAYQCPVCDKLLSYYSFEKAKSHVNVSTDNTRLPIGLFFFYMCKDKPLYATINCNSGKLDSDHSFVHTLANDYLSDSGVLNFQGSREVSYRNLLRRFEKKLSRFLSQDEFDQLFFSPENRLEIEGHGPIRTCPQLEGIVAEVSKV